MKLFKQLKDQPLSERLTSALLTLILMLCMIRAGYTLAIYKALAGIE